MKKKILPLLMFLLITGMGFAQTHTMIVTVPDTTMACYAAGSFNGWSPTANPMTKISDSPKQFSLQFEMADTSAVKVEYKFLSGPDWKYQQKSGTNFVFGTDSATAVVDTFNAIYNPAQAKDVIIDVLVPKEVYELNITGNFNSWNPTANPMEKVDSTVNGKEFKAIVSTLDTTTLEFKFIAGPGWAYEQKNSANYKYMVDGGVVVCDSFKNIYDPKKVGDITINITVPEGTPAVWILGSYNNWSLDGAIEATKNEDGTYTAVIPMVQEVEYKCWNHNDWPYEEAKDAEGHSLDANRTASFEASPVYNITVLFWKKVFGTPTGVKEPLSSKYRMYTTNGTVVVEGVSSVVSVIDLYGRLVQSVKARGTFTSKALQPGIYIIRIDGQAQKIFVR
jgi:hypothetical protein